MKISEVIAPCYDIGYDFRLKRCSVRLYPKLFVGGLMSYVCCLFYCHTRLDSMSNMALPHPYFVFIVDNPASWNNIAYTEWHQNDKEANMYDESKEYRSTEGKGPFHTHCRFRVWVILFYEDPIVTLKCWATKALFLYFNLYLRSVMLNSFSCSFISISFLNY